MEYAGMAELVDAHDSKSCGVIHESSILSPGTIFQKIQNWQKTEREMQKVEFIAEAE